VTSWHVHGLVLPEGIERDVYVVDGRLSFEPIDGAVTLATDVYLVPGLVDAHAHLSLFSPAADGAPPEERVRASARAHLEAGVLAVREPGSPDRASAGLGPDEGLPRVVTAGRFLAPPGRYFPGLAREVVEAELPDAALEELAASGDWVKLIGDSPLPGPGLTPTFAEDAVTETVRRVHAAGGRVAMHCSLPEVVQLAIDSGIDSLEHATFLRTEQVASLAASGAAWVPTMSINEAIAPYLTPELASLLPGQAEAIREAVDAGVPVIAGTDAGMGPHGLVRNEIRLIAATGVPAAQALGAGSWAARSLLRLPGIEDGAPADVVGFRRDPREDLGVLAEPALIVLDGQVTRRP